MADLEYSVDDGVGTIRLNRPERKNAFTMGMIAEWGASSATSATTPTSASWW